MPCSGFPWAQHRFFCLFRKSESLVCAPAMASLITAVMVDLAPRRLSGHPTLDWDFTGRVHEGALVVALRHGSEQSVGMRKAKESLAEATAMDFNLCNRVKSASGQVLRETWSCNCRLLRSMAASGCQWLVQGAQDWISHLFPFCN